MAHLERRITRRRYLGLSLGLMSASLLAACGQAAATTAPAKPAEAAKPAQGAPAATTAPAPAAAAASKEFDWQQFKGETLNIQFNKHPHNTVIEESIPEFTQMTGITVNFEDL